MQHLEAAKGGIKLFSISMPASSSSATIFYMPAILQRFFGRLSYGNLPRFCTCKSSLKMWGILVKFLCATLTLCMVPLWGGRSHPLFMPLFKLLATFRWSVIPVDISIHDFSMQDFDSTFQPCISKFCTKIDGCFRPHHVPVDAKIETVTHSG